MPFLSLWPIWKPKRRTEKQTSCPAGGQPPVSSLRGRSYWSAFPPAPMQLWHRTVTQLSPWMDPFNNSQQNTKEEDMNPNKHIMVVCVFLSSCPAWDAGCVSPRCSNTISGGGRMDRCSTPGLTQHLLPNRTSYGGVTERRRRSKTFLQHNISSMSGACVWKHSLDMYQPPLP